MAAYSRTTYEVVPTPDQATFPEHHVSSSYANPRQSAISVLSEPLSPGSSRDEDQDDPFLQHEAGSSSFWGKAKAGVRSNAGLLLVAASQAFFSLVNVAVKKLNTIDPPVTALQLILVRMGITTICCVIYMYGAKVEDPLLGPKGVRILLVARGLTGFFSLFATYYSLQYLSLSDATVLTFLTPMYTAVAGAMLLGEVITRRQILAGVASLIGVILIARPEALFGAPDPHPIPGTPSESPQTRTAEDGVSSAQRLIAVGVGFVGPLGAAGAFTTLRAIGKRAHPLHALTSFASQSVLASGIAMIIRKEPFILPTRPEWLALFAVIGVFGLVAQVLLTLGLQRETASRGSMALYTQVIFAGIYEHLWFTVEPSILSGVGTLLIISSAMSVVLSKKPEGATRRPRDSVALVRVSEDEEIGRGLLHDHDREAGVAPGTKGARESADSQDIDEDQDLTLPLHGSR